MSRSDTSSSPEMSFDPDRVIRKALSIQGNAIYSMSAYDDAVAFLQTHAVPLDEMVTHRFGVEQASEAFALFSRGETGKVIFEWKT